MSRRKKTDATTADVDDSALDISIEQAMDELLQIVSSLESGTETLDESLRLFERGTKLMRICHQQLDAAAQRIDVITRLDTEGHVELAPFDSTATGVRKENERKAQQSGGELF